MSNQEERNESVQEIRQETIAMGYAPTVAPLDDVSGTEQPQHPQIDADDNGHLATGLFVGVITVLLVLIYAFASAA